MRGSTVYNVGERSLVCTSTSSNKANKIKGVMKCIVCVYLNYGECCVKWEELLVFKTHWVDVKHCRRGNGRYAKKKIVETSQKSFHTLWRLCIDKLQHCMCKWFSTDNGNSSSIVQCMHTGICACAYLKHSSVLLRQRR